MSNQKQKKYFLDIDLVLDFIFSPDEKRSTTISLEEVSIPDSVEVKSCTKISQKTKKEEKKDEHPQHEVIRFELFKMLYDQVSQFDLDNKSIVVDDFNFGDELAYNTLINYGFIKIMQ